MCGMNEWGQCILVLAQTFPSIVDTRAYKWVHIHLGPMFQNVQFNKISHGVNLRILCTDIENCGFTAKCKTASVE